MDVVFLLNLPGMVDEVVILLVFVYWVGPYDVLYSLQHFYHSWVEPRARPYVDQLIALTKAESRRRRLVESQGGLSDQGPNDSGRDVQALSRLRSE